MQAHSITSRDELLKIQEKFVEGFVRDDPDLLFTLLDHDCEWIIMPTGESFRGLDRIRWLMTKVSEARTHSDEARLVIRNKFAGDDTVCIEYNHRGVVTKGFPSVSTENPQAGYVFDIDFCVTAHVTNGKIDRVREYFDQGQFTTSPEKRRKIFS